MIALDRSALVCDLAEYYHIYEMRELPPETVAVLACGLPPASRIVRKLSGSSCDLQTMMQACILDYLAILVWFKTKDGQHNRNRPRSYVQILLGEDKKEEKEENAFASKEEFEARRQYLLQEINDGIRTGESIRTSYTDNEGDHGDSDEHPERRSRRRRKKRRR